MQIQALGKSTLSSSRLAYGGSRLAGGWTASAVTPEQITAGIGAVAAAFEAGYTLFDNADIYCDGMCETIFGKALKQIPGMRERIVIATKCGIVMADNRTGSPYRYDLCAGHILRSCEQSLARLGVETIDLYQLHRADLLLNPTEVAAAFDKLKQQGKVREFGVSNFSPTLRAALQKNCPFPLIVNQVEIHLGRLDCLYDGTLDQCLAESITPLAWSPLGGGYLGSNSEIPRKDPRRRGLRKLQAAVDTIAREHNVPRPTIALAWLLKHPSHIIPIIGSINPDHIREATQADAIDLSREDWYRLLVAARMRPLE